jgi:hypothetical protein
MASVAQPTNFEAQPFQGAGIPPPASDPKSKSKTPAKLDPSSSGGGGKRSVLPGFENPFNKLPEHKPASDNPPTTSDEDDKMFSDDDEDDEEERREKEEFLNQGADNGVKHHQKQHAGSKPTIPPKIRKLYCQAYALVRVWWKGKVPATHEKSIGVIMDKIKEHNYFVNRHVVPTYLQDEFDREWPKL